MQALVQLLVKMGGASCRRANIYSSIVAVLALGVVVGSVGCGPDPATQALRDENAALRKEAARQAAQNGPVAVPLSDSSRPPTTGSTGTVAGSPSTSPATSGTNSPLSDAEIQDAMTLDLPVYPGAKLFKPTGRNDNSVLMGDGLNIVMLESPDKLDPIVAFYMDKMATDIHDGKRPGYKQPPSRSERIQDRQRVVTLSDLQPGNGMRSVTIHEDVGRTYIELMHISGKRQIPGSVLPNSGLTGPAQPSHSGAPNSPTPAGLSATPLSTLGPKAASRADSAPPKQSPPSAQSGGQPTSGSPANSDLLNPPLVPSPH